MSLIIGFGHKRLQGKDTAVEHLVKKYAGKFDVRRYAFGDLLKQEMYDLLQEPLHPYWEEAVSAGEYSTLPRHLYGGTSLETKVAWINNHKLELGPHLQYYGTEYRRKRDYFYWVRALRAKLAEEQPQIALISDLRFANEFYYIKAAQGYAVKVTKEGMVARDNRSDNHPSETELDGYQFDYEISVREGEVAELQQDAETVFERIVSQISEIETEEVLV